MELRALGRLHVAGSALRRPKPLLLLTYLAMEGTKPRQHLSELFFSEARDAADALGTTLRRLRAAGGFVHEDGGGS